MRTRGLPYDMFDHAYSDLEARRARRMESIYHVGQDRIWDGREVLTELLAKHGKPQLAYRERRALSRIFSIIMWGELAAWSEKLSAQPWKDLFAFFKHEDEGTGPALAQQFQELWPTN